MEKPFALKLNGAAVSDVYRISIDPVIAEQLLTVKKREAPAVVITRTAAILPNLSAGVIDGADIVRVEDGDWTDAILIVLPPIASLGDERRREIAPAGDAKFLAEVERSAPNLASLAAQTVAAIRAAGVDGGLVEADKGRWVNRPLNTFTLKAQPRAGNLQFTLYGNPETYDADGFLLKDQNSYSRGWVRSPRDVRKLAELTRLSHMRRKT